MCVRDCDAVAAERAAPRDERILLNRSVLL